MRDDGQDPIVLDAGDMFFSTTNLNKNNLESEKHRCETMLSGYEKIGCDGTAEARMKTFGSIHIELSDLTRCPRESVALARNTLFRGAERG